MLWEGWLTSAANGLNTTVTQAGIIISLIFTMAFIIIVAVATKGREAKYLIPFTGMAGMIFFTYIQWFPVYLGSVIALVIALWIGLAGSGRL